VAFNKVIDELRRSSTRQQLLAQSVDAGGQPRDKLPPARFASEVADDMLRMLFICCDDAIPPESQMVFALKTLCGFSATEIALRLFTSEANVFKRFARTRHRLREIAPDVDTPSVDGLKSRLPRVQAVLYLLFNEGYLSAHAEEAIRRELCDEAVRLTTILAEHPVGATPDTFALLALMHLHVARLGARQDALGGLLLLEQQDRTLWDQERILVGARWLARSAAGDAFCKYHAEAGIAAEHCRAPSFRETRWREISDLYAMLERIDPSPLHTMNRAVATAEWQGPEAALAVLEAITPPAWLVGSYLWVAVSSDLHRRAGHLELAQRLCHRALDAAPTAAVRDVLRRRLATAA